MNILWITNIALPAICESMGMKKPSIGGWMQSSLNRLKAIHNGVLAVATVYSGTQFIKREIDGICYYMLPLNGKPTTKYNAHLENLWIKVQNDIRPDVIHIHGSEYPHGLAYVNACGARGVVVSIQGIISCIARYYAGGIGYKSIKNCFTLRDFLKRAGILSVQKSFELRGKLELELFKKVRHVIGRTEWDKAHTWAINPNAQYHHCGETLRESFYRNHWSYSKCEPHTIFVSQASYPIKGLHILFKAMPLILSQYPDTKVYVAGSDETAKPWYRITSYGKYLKQLIEQYGLRKNVEFTGMLSEEQMCQRYLDSNLFICCSAIENSPNSLGEAQLLGVPHLATFVGGVPEMVYYNPDVLYRFEEYEMLARKVCNIFALEGEAHGASFNSKMYDGNENLRQLLETYSTCTK